MVKTENDFIFIFIRILFLQIGVRIMKYFRPDLQMKFEKLFNDDRMLTYLYHCNAQIPTGEQAFRTISDLLAWAKGLINFHL